MNWFDSIIKDCKEIKKECQKLNKEAKNALSETKSRNEKMVVPSRLKKKGPNKRGKATRKKINSRKG